ncbi:MAG: hypothetical protein HY540_01855 [Deltaproteobacteria bacterium]|nr:hypothetical protein [Deltaproteobacteria bacterium]
MLKLDKDDPQAELEFEVKCALEYTQAERIHKMLDLTKTILKLAGKYADRKTPQIIKRPSR